MDASFLLTPNLRQQVTPPGWRAKVLACCRLHVLRIYHDYGLDVDGLLLVLRRLVKGSGQDLQGARSGEQQRERHLVSQRAVLNREFKHDV